MATVRLSFTPAPAHVRTARLVGVAVARRAGVSDPDLDEVRLAIGEACSRAVALHRRHNLPDLVQVELQDQSQFTVRVTDRAPAEVPGAAVPLATLIDAPDDAAVVDEEDVAVGMGLTLLAGLVSELSVRPGPAGVGTEVEMSWPAGLGR
jgi:anti-sigma regulatory factor (Ser/Thr protein kinase)